MVQKRAHTKRTTSTEAAGNLTEREKGSFCFLIIDISYNARYAKLREVKIPISRIFGASVPAGSFLGSVRVFCAFCTFYHVLLFYLSRTFRCFPCYALLHWFVCNFSKHLCACFITFRAAFYNLQFAAVVVHLFLCKHCLVHFYQVVSMDAPVCMTADCL